MQRVLHTARLTLRPCVQGDEEVLHRHWTEPDVRRHLWDGRIIGRNTVHEEVQASVASSRGHDYGLWIVIRKRDGVFHGVCGLRDGALRWPELIFSVATRYAGGGIATEAARGVLRHAFEALRMERIMATVDAPNLASIRVLEKLGFSPMADPMGGTTLRCYAVSAETFAHLPKKTRTALGKQGAKVAKRKRRSRRSRG